MDKQRIAECFARARQTYEREAHVQHQVAERMLTYLLEACPDRTVFTHIAEVGCGTGLYSHLLQQTFRPEMLWLNDLCPEMKESLTDLLVLPTVSFTPGDAEEVVLPRQARTITSCSTFQWFTDLPAFFHRCYQVLPPRGILAFTTFGGENLREIRTLTGHGLHYPTLPELCEMLSSNYRVLYASEEVATLAFPTPTEVLRHLKQTGVTGTEKRIWTRTRLQHFTEEYSRLFPTEDGQVTLTYHPVYVIAERRGNIYALDDSMLLQQVAL